MKFEVIGRDGKVKMHTSDRQCIPPDTPVQALLKAGCKCLLDGKFYKGGHG